MRILVVDDDEGVRRVLIRMLEKAGHTTCWAANGTSALAQLSIEPVDVIILDIDLGPGMSGYDVARRLPPDVKLLILSGKDPNDIRREAVEMANAIARARGILGKPIDRDALLKTLAHLAGTIGKDSGDEEP